MNLFSMLGKTVVVTGGNGHLGSAMTHALLDAGAKVYVLARSKERFHLAFKGQKNAVFIECNFLSDQEVDLSIAEIKRHSKKIDVLINNAISAPHWLKDQVLNKDPLQAWDLAIQGGLSATVKLTQKMLPLIKKSKKGSIINIASMYGVVAPDFRIYTKKQIPSPAYYAATKGALIQWTRYLAVELAPFGIRVNCISPGPFPKESVYSDKQFIKNLVAKVPLGRLGKPEDLKGPTLLLASDASAFLTGQNLVVDGGWTVW